MDTRERHRTTKPSPPPGDTGDTADQPDPNKGKVLANTYRLGRLLGEGGMGKVYEAWHTRLGKKRYAVKLLRPGSADDMEAYARFRREAEIATEIGHPHIVEVHDFNTTDEGQPFIVMELLRGHDLFEHIRRNNGLEHHEVINIVSQVGRALEAAHQRGVVHRDLKPENIFITRSADDEIHVKLLDFGLSKIKHGGSRLTRQNTIFGTPHYMAPEQARGKAGSVDHRTDIFALGVIVYQCLCGELPFDAPTPLGVLYSVCHGTPKPLASLVPSISPVTDAVLARAMAKRREQRYESVKAFIDELRDALENTEQIAPGSRTRVPAQRARTTQDLVDGPASKDTPVISSADSTAERSVTEPPSLFLDETPPPPPAIEPNPRFGDEEMTAPKPRTSAGELVAHSVDDLLPPGAPPVPEAALKLDHTPLPSIMVEKRLRSTPAARAPGGTSADGTPDNIHELDTGEAKALVAPSPADSAARSVHDLPTAEMPVLPDVPAEQVITAAVSRASGAAVSEGEMTVAGAAPMAREKILAIVIFALVMVTIGVVVALLTIHA